MDCQCTLSVIITFFSLHPAAILSVRLSICLFFILLNWMGVYLFESFLGLYIILVFWIELLTHFLQILTVQIYWAHLAMILRWMMFGEIFGQIGFFCFIKHVVMSLLGLILYPIEPHICFFGRFSCMVLSSIPYMVELYVRMGFACCVWPISSVVTLTGYPASDL